ncbi:MAG: DNA translocase FtsK [Lachnospiraceae bacterium]|nr:DNA translocase FtsK [Lachnospiraceae bacterium]
MATGAGRKSSSASRRGSSARGKRKGSAASKRRQERIDVAVRDEVLLWIGLAVTILLFLCNFHLIGKAGDAISSVMFGLFGMLAYIFPLFAFFGIVYVIVNIGSPVVIIKEISAVVMFLVLEVAFSLMAGVDKIGSRASEYYSYANQHIVTGGVIGGGIARGLTKGIGVVGTVCILLILFAICFVLMTEKSILTAIKNASQRLYDNMQQDMDYRIERNDALYEERQERAKKRREREEAREKLRAEEDARSKKVRGVTFDTDLTPEYDRSDEETADQMRQLQDEEAPEQAAAQKSPKGSKKRGQEGKQELLSRKLTIEDMEQIRITGIDDEEAADEMIEEAMREGSLANAVIEADRPVPFEDELSVIEDDPAPRSEVRQPRKHRIEVRSEHEEGDTQDLDMRSITEALEDAANLYVKDAQIGQPAEGPMTPLGQAVSAAGYPAQRQATADTPVTTYSSSIGLGGGVQESKAPSQPEQPLEMPKPKPRPYKRPPIDLLKRAKGSGKSGSQQQELRETAAMLQQTLETFKVSAKVTDISRGPAVTRYELQPEPGVKVSKIVSLTDDLKLALAATDIRIEAPIPGKSAVGIEVPNKENTMVSLRELIDSDRFKKSESCLSFAVGKDIAGQVIVSDIAKMPHVLIAGSTGSGKSVCINTLIMSILYKAKPDEVKMILVDPKVVELSVYNGIPHLLLPVVTDPKKASAALQWGVNEMMDRYKKFEEQGVRDLKGYNKKMESAQTNNGQPVEKLPQIVIIVDELADLMMVAPGEVEDSICRLAQLARAAGIHLVIATQRPSVDVITGLIKANMPSRIAFAVSSGIDSRTILDMVGAEKLLGKGDMLFYPQGVPKPVRVQGAFVSDSEVADVVDFLKEHPGETTDEAENQILKQMEVIDQGGDSGGDAKGGLDERDSYFADAGRFIIEKEKASIGMLQRVFKIGFNRAARIMDQLTEYGVVGPEEGTKPRKVLMSIAEFEQLLEEI